MVAPVLRWMFVQSFSRHLPGRCIERVEVIACWNPSKLDGPVTKLLNQASGPGVAGRTGDEGRTDSARIVKVRKPRNVHQHMFRFGTAPFENAVERRGGHEHLSLHADLVLAVDFEQAEGGLALVILFAREADPRQPVNPLSDFFPVGENKADGHALRLKTGQVQDSGRSARLLVVEKVLDFVFGHELAIQKVLPITFFADKRDKTTRVVIIRTAKRRKVKLGAVTPDVLQVNWRPVLRDSQHVIAGTAGDEQDTVTFSVDGIRCFS